MVKLLGVSYLFALFGSGVVIIIKYKFVEGNSDDTIPDYYLQL